METFKSIKNYEGYYEISDCGNVKNSKTGRILKQYPKGAGYLMVALCKNGKTKWVLVHRLVAEHFIHNPDNLSEVNHKDENKLNNHVSNLEYCDRIYNMNYGNCKEKISKKKTSVRIIIQYTKEHKFVKKYNSSIEIKNDGYNYNSVSKCCRKQLKSHKGYLWEYEI